jgi:D-erythrulose 1-phosphate 3-epimerase
MTTDSPLPTPRLHLGINTCFAVKRWPEPEQWLDIVKNELGLACCQFSLDLLDPMLDVEATRAYAARTRAYAAEHDVLIHSSFTGLAAYSWSLLLHPDAQLRAAAERWYERAVDITAWLGAAGTGGHIGAFSVRDAADPVRKAALVTELQERLRGLSRYAARKGLRFLLFENMAVSREWGHSIEEAQALSQLATDDGVPLVLCLDIGHPCALRTGTSSDDYLAWFAQFWRQTPVVHLQQTDATGDHHWPFTRAYNAQGMILAEKVCAALQQWSGAQDIYLFLEAIHPFEAEDALVLRELRASVEHWRALLPPA